MVLVVTLFACDNRKGEQSLNPQTNSAALKEIEEFTGVQFPEGATVIRYGREMEFDALVRAKLVLTPSQWQSFLGHLLLDPSAFEEDQRYLLGSNFDWWNPQDAKQLPTVQARLPDAKVLNVGVDQSDPQHLLVFFVWHET